MLHSLRRHRISPDSKLCVSYALTFTNSTSALTTSTTFTLQHHPRIQPSLSTLALSIRSFTTERTSRRYPAVPLAFPVPERHYRIAHVTDLHWFDQTLCPDPSFKQLIGYTNGIMHRRYEFCDRTRTEILSKIEELKPDLVLITGDLTSIGAPTEFTMAKQGLRGILRNFPTYIVPGNHDILYHKQSEEHFYKYFGEYLPIRQPVEPENEPNRLNERFRAWLGIFSFQDIIVMGMPVFWYDDLLRVFSSTANLPHNIYGLYARFLNRRNEIMNNPTIDYKEAPRIKNTNVWDEGLQLRNKFIIQAQHYPLLDADGRFYHENHSSHCLTGQEKLYRIFGTSFRKPDLIIHGHDHMGMSQRLDMDAIAPYTYDKTFYVGDEDEGSELDNRSGYKRYRDEKLLHHLRLGEIRVNDFEYFERRLKRVSPYTHLTPEEEEDEYDDKKRLERMEWETTDMENRMDSRHRPGIPPCKGYTAIHNPGSGGLKYAEPKSKSDWHKYAAFNMYNVRRATNGRWWFTTDRYIHDGHDVIKQNTPYQYLDYRGKPFIRGIPA